MISGSVRRRRRARARLAIEETTPAAAVLDVRLGRDEVGPVAQALAERGIPFLFHTGHADSSALASWSDAIIVRKPAPPEELIDKLHMLIAGGSGARSASGD